MSDTKDKDTSGEATPATPEEIEREIEQTREALGETVEALTAKLDVKAQAQKKVAAAKDATTQAAQQVTEQGKTVYAEQPAAVIAGAAAVLAAVIGLIVWGSRR